MAYSDGYGGGQVQFPPFRGWVKRLVIVNAAIFLGLFFVDFFASGFVDWVYATFGLSAPSTWGAIPPVWQVFTYGWLHAPGDPTHVLFNMLGLYFFGEMVQGTVGERRFLVHYCAAIVAGGVIHWIMAALLGWPNPAIGASGGVLAMIVAAAVMLPNAPVIFIIFQMKLWVLAAILVGLDVFMLLNEMKGGAESMVAHSIHLAGAAYGFLAVKRRWIWNDPVASVERKVEAVQKQKAQDDDKRMDELLAKISREGIGSLTRGEKAFMKRQSERQRKG